MTPRPTMPARSPHALGVTRASSCVGRRSTASASGRFSAIPRALLLGLVLALGLSSCGLFGDDAPAPSSPAAAPPDAVTGIQAVLDKRARALRTGDRARFAATLGGDRSFRRTQLASFSSIEQLPVSDLRLTVRPADVVLEGESYWAVVEVRMQLVGYDAVPVTTRDRYLFTPVAGRPGRFRIASTTDAAWEVRNGVVTEPWDAGAVQIREQGGVLGVFDDRTVASADRVLSAVERGISEVSLVVPYDWTRQVVVYAVTDPAFLQAVAPVSADTGLLAGVAFEVRAGVDSERIASTRIVLGTDPLAADDLTLDRLVRHELTHVAIGTHDDAAPRWLQEGLAEYVSTRALRPQQRRVPRSALETLRTTPRSLPTDDEFNTTDVVANYALAWFVCEQIARTDGESRLWGLLDTFALGDTPPEDAGAAVVREQLGVSATRLVRSADRLLLSIYAPQYLPAPEPSEPSATPEPDPSLDPSADPSASATAGPGVVG